MTLKNRRQLASLTLLAVLILGGCGANKSIQSNGTSGGIGTDAVMGGSFSGPMISGIQSATGSSSIKNDSISSMETQERAPDSSNENNNSNVDITLEADKLVYTANITLESLEFDKSLSDIKTRLQESGCIIQSENFYDNTNPYEYYGTNTYNKGNRRVDITIRVKADSYNILLDSLKGDGHVLSLSSNVDNITTEYNNKQIYLESNRAQLDRLQQLYASATEIEDMISIESRISELQAEINSLETEIRRMDMDVSYSTINLTLREVDKYTLSEIEKERMPFYMKLVEHAKDSGKEFIGFLEGIVIAIMHTFWYIAIIAVIAYVLYRKRSNKINKAMESDEGLKEFIQTSRLNKFKAYKIYEKSRISDIIKFKQR